MIVNPITQRLIAELSRIPEEWPIVPTNGNKRPLGYRWQYHPLHSNELIQQLQYTGSVIVRNREGNLFQAYPKGFGILTGYVMAKNNSSPQSLVAVDVDGISAMTTLLKLSKTKALPRTVAFTSGKPGRCQYLFSIPAGMMSLNSHKLPAPVAGEALEIRYAGMMSVLPPSVHPETGCYRWVKQCSPAECAIAPAPEWLLQLMHSRLQACNRSKAQQRKQQSLVVKNDRIAALLSQLAPWRADDYHEWVRIGMALYSHSPTLLPLWDEWSRQSSKYEPGECQVKWSTFSPTRISLGTLYYLAQLDSCFRKCI